MRIKYRIARIKFFILKIISFFFFGKEKRKRFLEGYKLSKPLLCNEFIVVDKKGKSKKFPNYKNCTIEFKGCANKVVIREPQAELRNLKILCIGNNSSVEIDSSNSVISGLNIFKLGTNSLVKIGKNFSTRGCLISFSGEDDLRVEIGDNCLFGADIKMQPTDSHSILDYATGECLNFGKDIKVGNHVWVCKDVVFLKGSIIPDDSVVAAKTLVAGFTPPSMDKMNGGMILAGVPAKIVKKGINWSGSSPKHFKKGV